jgi:2-polyprenyl-3-methyl-5-hydroxy-6-metoxy-1,4-benzoquinol methylase
MFQQLGNPPQQIYQPLLGQFPNSVTLHNICGAANAGLANYDNAIDSYKQAIKIKPDYAEAYNNMGVALKGMKFSRPISELPEIIVNLLNNNTYVRPEDIVPAAVSLIKLNEVFQSVLNRYFSGDLEHTLEQSVSELSRIPLLLKMVEVCPITDLEVEWLLTFLRSAIVTNVSQLSGSTEILTFQAALALQCFANEYVYTQTDEDTKILVDLENTIQKNIADRTQPAPLVLACLASYKALYGYSWCHLLALPDDLKQLEKSQISDVKKETVLRNEIPMLNEITDDVSSKVRQQYEENPYPRWVSLGLPLAATPIADITKKINIKVSDKKIYDCKMPQILVAGCGTGQHSIGTAARFKNCNVLAIDLSLSSLAYAKRKTEELGLKNIEYMQADILDLDKLGRQFDMVESAGVLHHMNDPMAGWSVLTNCLKPGGLMKIGLYSELARQHIVKMREEIQLANLGSDDFSMKSFRTGAINSDQKHHKKIVSSYDFHSLSALRDLLFHVQEHRFTIPQIKKCLKDLGLEFCGFEIKDIVKQFKISNTGSENLYDLDEWNTFEQDNPNIFVGMYQFWCQKVL